MPKIPFCGPTYVDKTLWASAQDAINLYPMITIDPATSDKKVSYPLPKNIIMYPSPGYKWQVNLGNAPIRALFTINSTLYIICGASLILCTPIGGNTNLALARYTTIGTLNTTSGQVSVVCNTVQLAISDAQYGYTYTLATGAFAVIGNNLTISAPATSTVIGDALTLSAAMTATLTTSSNTLTGVASPSEVTVGMLATGSHIPSSSNVTSIIGTDVVLSNNCTSSGTETVTFTASTTGNTNGTISIGMIGNSALAAIGQSVSGSSIPIGATVVGVGSLGGFPANGGVTNFTYYDGYVVAAINGTKTVIQSNQLDATTWQAQAFDTLTSMPDNINAVFSDELQLYIGGPKITEVQADAGSIPYAFQRVPNVLIQAGFVAWATIQKVANTFFFLASDIAGKSFIAALNSYDTKVISTPPINEEMERYTTVSDAFAYAYREGDNHFYVITFPSANATWAYDIKTDMWHKRSINGGADLPTCCVLWQGQHVVGDAQGNLQLMSQNYSTYSSYNAATGVVTDTPMQRTRVSTHLNSEGKTLFIHELWVDMQVGQGFVTDSNLNPQTPSLVVPKIVQQANHFRSGGTTNTVSINSSTKGNLLAVFVQTNEKTSVVTGVTDNLGQIWSQVPNAQAIDTNGPFGRSSDIWYYPNTLAGVTSVTVSFVASAQGYSQVTEISGCAQTNPVDSVAISENPVVGSASIVTTGALTTTQPYDFVLCGMSAEVLANSVLPPYTLGPDGLGLTASFVPSGVLSAGSARFSILASGLPFPESYCCSSVAFFAAQQPTIPVPQATLFVSRDYGQHWHNVGTRSIGAVGKTTQRVLWRNLGRFRQNATFKLVVSDPAAVFITGAQAQVKVGIK